MKNRVFLFFVVSAFFMFLSCEKSSDETETKESNKEIVAEEKNDNDAYILLEQKCLICHTDKKDVKQKDLVAPPIAAVKLHYLPKYKTREAFVENMSKWVKNPNKENSRMKGAIKKFGLMPTQKVSDEELNTIVGYIYDTELKTPSWFQEHYEDEHGKNGKKFNN